MKLKLEVVELGMYGDTSIVLKPLSCGLEGTLTYKNLPVRARERFKVGTVVEAEVPLPDYYPELKNHCKEILYFEDLQVGERFYWGNDEYLKTITVYHGVSENYPQGLGFSNNIQILNGQTSGMGPRVEVMRVHSNTATVRTKKEKGA